MFAFLTTEPNAIVAPIHAKAMPVILTKTEEVDAWITAPATEALSLQAREPSFRQDRLWLSRPGPARFPAHHSCRQTAPQALLARVCA